MQTPSLFAKVIPNPKMCLWIGLEFELKKIHIFGFDFLDRNSKIQIHATLITSTYSIYYLTNESRRRGILTTTPISEINAAPICKTLLNNSKSVSSVSPNCQCGCIAIQ